jgi:GNAT superfamily N-acetyltransferase
MIHISNAQPGDETKLSEVAISAFCEADRHFPQGAVVGGPPEHNLEAKHLSWINECFYVKCEKNGEICGGCIAKIKGASGFIVGVFVAKEYMRKGCGSALIQYLFDKYPNVEYWGLETPDFLQGNHLFYETHGFEVISKHEASNDLGYGFITYGRST